jgi:uncharacterized membrane protein
MDDRRLESIMGNLLRIGVLVAAAVVTLGALLYLEQRHAAVTSFHTFTVQDSSLSSVHGILKLAGHLDSKGLIQLGLLLLIATPVARVVFAIIGFSLERDRLYVIVSCIVLAVLVFSLLHAT